MSTLQERGLCKTDLMPHGCTHPEFHGGLAGRRQKDKAKNDNASHVIKSVMMNTNSLSLRDIHLGISALDKIVVGDDENLYQNPEKARNIPTLAANPVPAVCGDTCTGSGGMCPFAAGPNCCSICCCNQMGCTFNLQSGFSFCN